MASASQIEVMDPDALRRYAEAIVGSCLAVRSGETLLIDCEPAHRTLVVAMTEAAYDLGAGVVDVVYTDRRVQRARIERGIDEAVGHVPAWQKTRLRRALHPEVALIRVTGDEEPGIFAGLDPARVALDFQRRSRAMRWFMRAVIESRIRWSIAAWPTAAWAKSVYPELPQRLALRALADDLLLFCRLGPDDAPDAWTAHAKALRRRAQVLTRRSLRGLEFRGPGTSLDISLPDDAIWLGGGDETQAGRMIYPNFPTEEVFTSPDPRGTNGTFQCTTPLSFSGRVIEGIRGEFRNGRLVNLETQRASDRELLAATLATDRTAGRLGEVALVDATSRIGQAGRIYGDTLFDENAAAHIAFGDGFATTRRADGALNRSAVHLDVMVGSPQVDVTGIDRRGRRVPLLRDGDWQI